MACVLGVVLNITGIGLPGWSGVTLGIISAAALPLGLLAVGVAIEVKVRFFELGSVKLFLPGKRRRE